MGWYAPSVGELESEEQRRSLRVERARDISRTALTLSLFVFFVATVLLGANVGNPLLVEDIAACSTLGVALSGFAHVLLGLSVGRRKADRL
jgi:hypothetical protein